MRAALVREDGLVVNVIELDWELPDSPYVAPPALPPDVTVVEAQSDDGTWLPIGPGMRHVEGRWLRPDIVAPAALGVGQQGTITLRWVDALTGEPVPVALPITLEVEGVRASYTPGDDGSVQVPITIDVPGTYRLDVVEPELDVVVASAVVTVS